MFLPCGRACYFLLLSILLEGERLSLQCHRWHHPLLVLQLDAICSFHGCQVPLGTFVSHAIGAWKVCLSGIHWGSHFQTWITGECKCPSGFIKLTRCTSGYCGSKKLNSIVISTACHSGHFVVQLVRVLDLSITSCLIHDPTVTV